MPSRYSKVKLTQSVVDRAKPDTTRYILTDTIIPGFWLAVEPNGRKTFKLRYRVGGGRGGTVREPKIGDAVAMKTEKARKTAAEWYADVTKGKDPSGERQTQRLAPTMAELFKRYLTDHARPHKRASSVEGDERLIGLHLANAFGRRKVAEVTRAEVYRFHKQLVTKPYQANRCLALLSKAFNLAEVWGWRPDGSNPCRHVKRFAEARRQTFLKFDELVGLGEILRFAEREGYIDLPVELSRRNLPKRAPISPFAIAAIRLLVFTGARKSEILSLRWDRISMSTGTALVQPKEGPTIRGTAAELKTLHLPPPALELLSKLQHLPDNPYVIRGGKPGAALVNLKDPWCAIREAAGLDGMRIHDLRHTFASTAASGGTSLPIIGALLGHSQPSTTARYTHLQADPLRAAAAAASGSIAAAMGETIDGGRP